MIIFIEMQYLSQSMYWLRKIVDILEKIKYPYHFKYQQKEITLKNIRFKAITWNDFEKERIGYRNFMEISGNEVEKVKPILEIIKKYELQGECKGKIIKGSVKC